ncbi:MAG: glycosyltransferase family 2 protein, partial [Pseudomonadota bacterium]
MSPAEQRRVAAVSVVVPVYNVRPHLEACLRSVLDQSLKELELIVVDDASTDDTHAVIAALADADERVRPVRLDAHGGASRARNFGLAEARGEYLIFLDGDDRWPNPGMLEELVAAARLNAADLTEFGFHRDDRSDPEWTQSPPPRRVTLSSSDPASLRYNVWARLIRRSLVTAHGMRFSEDLDIGEDALFSIGLYAVAEVVQQVDTPYYFYRNNPQGVTNARWDWNKLRSASSWFGTALEAIAATPHTERVAWMRRAVILERFMMLSRRLGVLAAHELDDRQLPEFMRLWSEP